jgi:hypothetical protein
VKGKKTYIAAGLVGAAAIGHFLGFIDQHTYEVIMGLLGGAGLAALRSAVESAVL